MTKGELVERLSWFGDDTLVLVDGFEGGFDDITLVGPREVKSRPRRWGGELEDYGGGADQYQVTGPSFKAVLLARRSR